MLKKINRDSGLEPIKRVDINRAKAESTPPISNSRTVSAITAKHEQSPVNPYVDRSLAAVSAIRGDHSEERLRQERFKFISVVAENLIATTGQQYERQIQEQLSKKKNRKYILRRRRAE